MKAGQRPCPLAYRRRRSTSSSHPYTLRYQIARATVRTARTPMAWSPGGRGAIGERPVEEIGRIQTLGIRIEQATGNIDGSIANGREK